LLNGRNNRRKKIFLSPANGLDERSPEGSGENQPFSGNREKVEQANAQ